MLYLKDYQESAVRKLKQHTSIINESYDTDSDNTIVFQAPTGSGKTVMVTKYIEEICEDYSDVCFLWISIGAGDLHKQSYRTVEKFISKKVKCSVIEKEFLGNRDYIEPNEVVFLNWEKIRNQDNEGEFTNILMKDSERFSFIDVLTNTRNMSTKVFLIIDESHVSANTNRAIEIRDEVIRPHLTIEMSATPVLTQYMTARVTVSSDKVIESGMIKKQIIVNPNIDKLLDDEISADKLILESAYQKLITIEKEYLKVGASVKPLMLIQLPNSRLGDIKRKFVIDFLSKKNIGSDRIAIWLSDEKINQEYEVLNSNDSKVEFLIFKQAIDTGWDCPRAQILVKFRESSSITFEIQTVGRILRMPEQKHYNNDLLDSAYVFTSIKSIHIKKETYNPNILKNLRSKRGDNYGDIALTSYYKNRIDYGDITSDFRMFFRNSFFNYFDIPADDDININNPKKIDFDKYYKILNAKGVDFDSSIRSDLVLDSHIDSKNVDSFTKIIDGKTVMVKLTDQEVENEFNDFLSNNLYGYAPKRSLSVVKTAMMRCFSTYLNMSPKKNGLRSINVFVLNNSIIFEQILGDSIMIYKTFRDAEIKKKNQGRYNSNWEIPTEKYYNSETFREIDSKRSIHKPLFLPLNSKNIADNLEADFIRFMDKEPNIEWYWKNGDEHMEQNFGIKKEDGFTFQPDFIVKFKNGSIGIFDTKDKKHNLMDTIEKSNALYKYLTEEKYRGKNLFGGIVVRELENFYLFSSSLFKSFEEDKQAWKNMSHIIDEM